MTAGFPSTTVTSLASFGTGLPPGETGLAGYAVRDPSTGRRTTLIGWETSTPPRVWQPHPTHFERITAAGCPAVFVGRRRFKDSAMTTASLRGAVFRGADSPLDRVEAAVQASRSGGVVYVYWGEIDKAGHEHGWQSWPWLHALEELDQSMAALRRALPASAALWLTSDHGMVDATAASTFDLADDPGMRQAVEIVAGEARAMHLYGPAPELIASSLRESLAERAWVLTKAEAVAEGLFGDHVSAHADQILGDVIVIAAGETAVVDSHTASPASLAMIGQHGSLTAAEMEIPLIEIPA
jgi:hypothetical protein